MAICVFIRFFILFCVNFLISTCVKDFIHFHNHDSHSILWINGTYIAEDMGLNISLICLPFSNDHKGDIQKNYGSRNETNDLILTVTNETIVIKQAHHNLLVVVSLTEKEPILYVENSYLASQLGLNSSLLELYEKVAVNLGQICKKRPRVLWINDSTLAKDNQLNTTLICTRFTKNDFNKSSSELLSINTTIFFNDNETHRQLKENKMVIESEADFDTEAYFVNASLTFDTVYVRTIGLARWLNLNPDLLSYHESIGIYLPGACKRPIERKTAVKTFNASEQLGASDSGQNIGISSETLKVNITELEETLSNDTAIDNILTSTNETNQRSFGGSFILPILVEQKYDAFQVPAVLKNQTVDIKIGVYVESISNFQSDTMDYEMDLYLRMAWRDPRLIHNLSQPILCKDEEIVQKLWRPDPYFSNSREASFHSVTFLNYVMRIFPTGEVLAEMRVQLKPSCNLILCKFPHDKQRCTLFIKSFAYPVNTVKFLWFTNAEDAVRRNPSISLPELTITDHSIDECDGSRSTGNFSCLKLTFSLKRELGFHIAQTYVPTALALIFSWIPVWMPIELMEARLGVPLTVLFTLSGDAAATIEKLPNVSYFKALDYWYNFITIFVFITMIQTLVVLMLDQKRDRMTVRANLYKNEEHHFKKVALRYHRSRIFIDKLCRYLYPVIFVCFLCIYYFVIIQGKQDSCITKHENV